MHGAEFCGFFFLLEFFLGFSTDTALNGGGKKSNIDICCYDFHVESSFSLNFKTVFLSI